jgi:hypothetical protein
MIRLNIHEAKTHMSAYLARLEEHGETIILSRETCRSPRSADQGTRSGKRPLGLARGKVVIRKGFFEPLTDELLDAFEGIESR